MARASGGAGGTGERVAREPLTGRVSRVRIQVVGSGPVGERATPTPGQDPHAGQRVLAGALLGFRERRKPRPTAAHSGRDSLGIETVVVTPQFLRPVIHMLIRDAEYFEIDSRAAFGQQLADR